MDYIKHLLNVYELTLEVKTRASEKTSCVGGHCVRARYENDY